MNAEIQAIFEEEVARMAIEDEISLKRPRPREQKRQLQITKQDSKHKLRKWKKQG
jgi:hypothetical protein